MTHDLEDLVSTALTEGASDLHLEPGMRPTFRIRDRLAAIGEPLAPETTADFARSVLDGPAARDFADRRSADLARTIRGARCRLSVLHTMRGVGLAIRILHAEQPTFDRLNLHPDLAKLAAERYGLILVSGPTGSGKSSTLAALIDEINRHGARHIVTLEHPIEFVFRPRKALIRQREVGRDTPSFERGLLDALREDPDVLMVGEMRDQATIRLTLDAAETGHLVLSTVHSSSVTEALHRVAAAFPAETQPLVHAQLADCLRAVVCQRLSFDERFGARVPECEILINSTPASGLIRLGQFSKLATVLETGARDGQWSKLRYRRWLDARERVSVTYAGRVPPATEELQPEPDNEPRPDDEVIVIQPPTESLSDIIEELGEDPV